MYYPSIVETVGRSSNTFDLPTKLLQDRIIYIGSEINEELANFVIMQLMWLNSVDPEKDIDVYINSPGGSVYDGLAIKDVIDSIQPKVNTIGIGMCASMGAYLLFAGTGERRIMKNCRIMIHSVSSGVVGTYHEQESSFKETKYIQDKIMKDIVSFSKRGLTLKILKSKTVHDYYMDANEAISMGLVDKMVLYK